MTPLWSLPVVLLLWETDGSVTHGSLFTPTHPSLCRDGDDSLSRGSDDGYPRHTSMSGVETGPGGRGSDGTSQCRKGTELTDPSRPFWSSVSLPQTPTRRNLYGVEHRSVTRRGAPDTQPGPSGVGRSVTCSLGTGVAQRGAHRGTHLRVETSV